MDLSARIKALIEIGKICRNAASGNAGGRIGQGLQKGMEANAWFTEGNIVKAFDAWAAALDAEKVRRWASMYPQLTNSGSLPVTVGVVMAGNIPLVGMHDLLCIILSGHRGLIRLSSDDKYLLPALVREVVLHYPGLKDMVTFTEGTLQGFDAVIATGSNNTSRYFEYYFSRYPNIIRKNRNSIAILRGHESDHELSLLGDDIFTYFGLGCRNVSKVFVPAGYHPDKLLSSLDSYRHVIDHHKYANNYDYQKAILMVNQIPFNDNGFLLMKEDESLFSPISVLHYEFYHDMKSVEAWLELHREQIQCAVLKDAPGDPFVDPGKSQQPELWDYADQVDVMEFLLSL